MAATPDHQPNPVDVHVGKRLRGLRHQRKMSQQVLADALGLTFQQVQKYEGGANRISASKLYEAATALRAPVTYFFEGLPNPATGDGLDDLPDAALSMASTPQGVEVAEAWEDLSGDERAIVSNLASHMARQHQLAKMLRR